MSKPMVLSEDAASLARPLRDVSKDELVQSLFLAAAKPDTQWFLGTEVELFTHHLDDHRAASHQTIAGVLERLGEDRKMSHVTEADGSLIGLEGGGQIVSLEPGGQLEFASSPHRSLQRMRDEFLDYTRSLRAAGEADGLGFYALGQQPFVTRDTAPRMPKPRYQMMRDYLGRHGTRGLDMMHLTGSVQCTVDFQSEKNLVNKVRTAARASPFLSALVAASPFTAGKINGFKTYRYYIWLDTDDERCGLWPEMLDEEGLRPHRYIARAMNAAPMFFIRDGEYLPAEDKPFSHYAQNGFADTTVTLADFLDHLTTFFPEVRTKGYVELRGADCVLPEEAVAIGGFWRGLLDDESARAEVDDYLRKMDYAALRALQPEVAKLGLDAKSPVGPVGDVVEWLVQRAYDRLMQSAPDCAECVVPLLDRAHDRRSPADEMLKVARKSSIEEALKLVRV